MKTKLLTLAICTVALFSVDLTYGYHPISPYAYCNNNPVKYVDPDGQAYDWYLNEETGELYYNKNQTTQTTTYQGNEYKRVGDNDMMGEMGNINAKYYSYDSAQSVASENGYKIEPAQQLVQRDVRTSKYQTGRNNVDIETGTEIRIYEKYDVITSDQHMKCSKTVTYEYEYGQTFLEMINGGKHTKEVYRDSFIPTTSNAGSIILNVGKVGNAIMGGQHDYINTTVYKSWNAYGNGPLIKYK